MVNMNSQNEWKKTVKVSHGCVMNAGATAAQPPALPRAHFWHEPLNIVCYPIHVVV